ncbi:macro domain-containing protein [Neobacillus mesonae]|uniref:macro domain-containing protein n=1 Tax=Neobacillus mesonae TaxID=1193713 RepID=UPI00203BB3C7|nr:macro domain-containing protein [Neobacillus mesonae]MCM3570434.1 DUF6430 domain-containing protein [Neobacillus mesonae]
MKVHFFDGALIKEFLSALSVVSLLLSFVLIVVEIPEEYKWITGLILGLLFIIFYFFLWIRANLLTKVRLTINHSTVDIKFGDIFTESELKVIAFNEYFDTEVDNKVISERSLNGMYINRMIPNVSELDLLMDGDERLNENLLEINSGRSRGKKKRYKLGSIFQHHDYLLTAFSRFDTDNRAFLYMEDYVNFLLHFWNEIDVVYSGRSVSIPLLGSGITRFKEYNMITDQELLELLLWSFKISRIKFSYPSKMSIVIHESKKDKINLYTLKA